MTKDELRAYQRNWRKARRAANPQLAREKDRQRPCRSKEAQLKNRLTTRYKLAVSDYRLMVERQKGLCAICGEKKHRLVIDHCHTSNKVRELLCDSCNTKLSGLEQADWRLKAEAYLEKHSGR